jgi:hypothetical protein
MPNFNSPTGRLARGRAVRAAAATIAVVAAATVLVTIIAAARRGFDLSDEAYYVLSMQDPAAYRMTSTLFGYALRPVYLLFGGSISALRVFGVAVVSGLGALAVGLLVSPRTGASTVAALAAGAALPAMYYGFWLPTPSYNWLVLAAGLLLLPAILLLADRRRGPAVPGVLAALAGLVAALAKPPTAAAYSVIFLTATVLLVRDPRGIARQLGLALGLTAAGGAALALLLPIETILAQTRGYIEIHGLAPSAGRGPFGDLLAFVGQPRGWPLVAALVAVGLATRPGRSTWRVPWGRAAAALAILAAAGGTILAVASPVYPGLGPGMAALAYAALAFALLGGADRRLCLALGLASLLPWAAALGSTNDLPSQTTLCAGIFGVVALIAVRAVRPTGGDGVLVALALVLITGIAVGKGLRKPYRLAGPILSQTAPVEVGASGERLFVDPRTAAFLSSLRDSATRNGFCARDPVIDFTGELPGVAVVLGGRTPALQWLFGGYPFSEKLAAWALSTVDAQTRDNAWVVVGEGRIAFSAAFVASLGFAIADGYELILEAKHPIYATPVRLYRPRALQTVSARCPDGMANR